MRTGTGRFIFSLAVWALVGLAASPSPAQPAGPVRFTEAIEHSVRRAVYLPGSIRSRTESVVASEVAGLVVSLDVNEGDRVRKGAPLAHLRTASLELELQAVNGQLKEASARLDLAESKLARSRRLFEDEVVSQDALDDAFSEFTAWQGRVDQTTALVRQLELDLRRCVIAAPFGGAVVSKRTDVGQWIIAGGPVVEMVGLEDLEVRVEVPEKYFAELRAGAEAAVEIGALGGIRVAGELDRVVPRADLQARSFPVFIRLVDPDPRIGVGMLARAGLPVGESYLAVLAPKDAVVRQGAQEMVYRITDDNTVEPMPVRTEQGIGDWLVVQGALQAGDRLVTRGNERLQPGQQVEGQPLEYPLP
jgi:RND family efflux transporter MFP subunit